MSALEPEEGPKPDTSMYSETAKMFHAWCSHLKRLHNEAKHDECREGCLQLLERLYAPHYVRVRTLHLLADSEGSTGAPGIAVYYAKKALVLLEKLDGTLPVAKMLLAENTKILERFETAFAKLEARQKEESEEPGMEKTVMAEASLPSMGQLNAAEAGDEEQAGDAVDFDEDAFFKAMKDQNDELRQKGVILDDEDDDFDSKNDPIEAMIRQDKERKQRKAAEQQASGSEQEQSARFVPMDTPGRFPK